MLAAATNGDRPAKFLRETEKFSTDRLAKAWKTLLHYSFSNRLVEFKLTYRMIANRRGRRGNLDSIYHTYLGNILLDVSRLVYKKIKQKFGDWNFMSWCLANTFCCSFRKTASKQILINKWWRKPKTWKGYEVFFLRLNRKKKSNEICLESSNFTNNSVHQKSR